jgi:hypothetical protein
MKFDKNYLAMFGGRFNRRHIRLILVILYIILFVLGAGAPGSESGIGL